MKAEICDRQGPSPRLQALEERIGRDRVSRWGQQVGDFPPGDHRNVHSVLYVGLRESSDALSCGGAARVVYSAALATRRRLP
jgi:hypothetical protein